MFRKKKIEVKKFKELNFKKQLVLLQEVVSLANYGLYLLLNKNNSLVDKEVISNSKIFCKDITFKETFEYFKEVLELLGLEEKTFQIWGDKVFYNGFPLSNIDKKNITPQLLEQITTLLANQYASVWQEKIKTYDSYDSILYENLMNQPLESIDDYIYLKEHEKRHKEKR